MSMLSSAGIARGLGAAAEDARVPAAGGIRSAGGRESRALVLPNAFALTARTRDTETAAVPSYRT